MQFMQIQMKKIDLDDIKPKHFKKWVDWAKAKHVGLRF